MKRIAYLSYPESISEYKVFGLRKKQWIHMWGALFEDSRSPVSDIGVGSSFLDVANGCTPARKMMVR